VSRWANKYVIGLTGNIAVGKSVVRQMLQHLGAYTIDADGLAHQAMSPGAPAYKPVVEAFGQFILDSEKRINRATLASLVFSNPQALAKLEAITHPVVYKAINTLVSRAKQPIVVIEAIKLLEGDLVNAVDAVWVVDAKPENQYRRLISKRKMSETDAKQRILSQPKQSEKLMQANLVIDNNGNVEETWKQVQKGWDTIRQTLAKPAAPATPPAAPAKPTAPATPAKPEAKPAAPPATAKPEAKSAAPAPTSMPAPAPAPTRIDTGEIPVVAAPGPETGLEVKRGMPNNAGQIADFINKIANKGISRMDIMMAFGEKSYLIAEQNSTIVAVSGWQVENLITRVNELYMDTGISVPVVIQALISAIEEASRQLQSEVGFVFLPVATGDEVLQEFNKHGYEQITIAQIKIPAWREAVQDGLADGIQILQKQLRKDRVLQPI
jgi:dephospho-CoA kinase